MDMSGTKKQDEVGKMNREKQKAEDFESMFQYPDELERLIALKLINFDLWYLMTKDQSVIFFEQLKKQCSCTDLIPFARRGDNDDIACFEIRNKERVVVLKNCEYLGYRPRQIFVSVWDWFRDAIETMIAFSYRMN